MAVGRIAGDEEAFAVVINNFVKASEDYKRELGRLTNLITEITNGDIRGVLAEDLRNKYEAKMDTFNLLRKTLEEAESAMEFKNKEFNNLISSVKSGMR